MKKGKILHECIPAGFKSNTTDIRIAVYGCFDTLKSFWEYYIISYVIDRGIPKLSDDLSPKRLSDLQHLTPYNVENYFTKIETLEEGKKYIEDFKIKWETGSNSTTQEQRDKKLKEILD